LDGDTLVVNKKSYFASDHRKPQDRALLLIKGIAQYGFNIDGSEDKKVAVFTVSCPDSPDVMRVVQSYFRSRPHLENCHNCTTDCDEQAHCWRTIYFRHTKLISHRFVEMGESVDFPSPFSMTHIGKNELLARTDFLPKHLR